MKDGKIAAIGNALGEADRVLDAEGLTLTPGFSDSHSQSDNAIKAFPNQREKIEQGITLSIAGQCGSSQGPKKKDGVLTKMSDFISRVKDRPLGSSNALLVGHNTIRTAVMGKVNRLATPEEIEKMEALVQDAMDAGAIGLSYGLYYVPGCYASTEEAVALAKVVKKNGGIIAAHIRNEEDGVIDAVKEFIHIIEESGCRGVFSHHKTAEKYNFGRTRETLALIDEANRKGADIYQDVYPYIASHTTTLARFVPKRFHPEGTTSALRLLDDPEIVARIKEWGEQWNNDLSWVLITSSPLRPEYEGMNVNEIADTMGEPDRMEALFRIIRERGVVPLPEMIRRMTSLPADVYGLTEKGRILVGKDADLCIFDYGEIADCADFVHCERKNVGLRYVVLNGEIVVENNEFNGIRAGGIYLKK